MSAYTQWYNENSMRKYPFNEHATVVDIAKDLTLPDNLIVDCNIMVGVEHTNIYMSYIKITPNIISLGIASTTAGLFTGTFLISDILGHKSQQLEPLVTNATGWIVFGDYRVTGSEVYRFNSYMQSGIDETVIRRIARPTISKLFKLGENADIYVDGIVRLKSGNNVRIYQHETDSQCIVVELLNPASFIGPCNPHIDIDDSKKTLHAINNVRPDSNGILTIRFDG